MKADEKSACKDSSFTWRPQLLLLCQIEPEQEILISTNNEEKKKTE
jgi:hypothetical protein